MKGRPVFVVPPRAKGGPKGGPQLGPGSVFKSPGDAGILGLGQVTKEALAPVAHLDDELSLEEMAWKVAGFIGRAASRYWEGEDRRLTSRSTAMQALAVIEEFAEAALLAIAGGLSETPWFNEADFTTPLLHAVCVTFEEKKIFLLRVVKPLLRKTLDDIVYRFREEERIQRSMWDGVVASGLPVHLHRKAFGNLQKAYDYAHMNAEYGACTGDTPEVGLVMDFTKCWMETFASRSWMVLEQGIGNDTEDQFAFFAALFQYVTDPARICLPGDLVGQPGAMPPEAWGFIADVAMQLVRGGEGDVVEDPAVEQLYIDETEIS